MPLHETNESLVIVSRECVFMLEQFSKVVTDAMARIQHQERSNIERAAKYLQQTILSGGVIHTFGSGHSSLVAADVVGRSGCPVGINQIIDKTDDMAERINGYGMTLMKHYEQQYQLLSNDCLIVISNSGRNPLPIEVAMAGQLRGLPTIAITNVAQANSLGSRHESGQNLSQVADVVIDTHLPTGETSLELPMSAIGVAPVSTLVGIFAIQCVVLSAVHLLASKTSDLPVYQSENAAFPDADTANASHRTRYQGRLRRCGA